MSELKDSSLLVFYMRTTYSTVLLEGKLLLIKGGKLLKKYDATSGCVGWQSRSRVNAKGKGALPPNCDVANKSYLVQTQALNRVNVKGIEGNAFAILPSSLNISGVQRGDFMIHRDANQPGSAGCIVLTNSNEWPDFQVEMKDLFSSNIKQISLIVDYYGN